MKKCECPIDSVGNILGSKWVIMLLRDVFIGNTRFSEFKKNNPTISNKVLTDKLQELIAADLLYKNVSEHTTYHLTETGKKLKPVIKEMVIFGKNYCKSEKQYKKLLSALK